MTEKLLIADGAVQYVPHLEENPSEAAGGSDALLPAETFSASDLPQEKYILPRANGTTTVIRPGVSMGVTSGGYTDILVQSGGILSVRSSGVVSDITVQPGGIIASAASSYDPGFIHKGSSTAFISELSGGAVTGIVSGLEFGTYSLPDSPFMQYGVLYIASGGRAVDVNVLSGGTLRVLSGGSASSVTVRGIVSFYKGAAGSNIQLTSGGTVAFTSKAYLYGRNSGGSIGSIDREGSVYNLSSVLIGCSGQNDEVLTVKGSASDLTISGGIPVYMSSYEYPVRVDIAENTLVNNLTVDRLGYVNVSSGAVVSNVNLLSSGVLNVLSGGTASVIFDPWNQTRAHAEEGAVVINQRDYNVYIGTYKLLSRTNEVLDGLTISSGSSALIYEGGRVVSSLVVSGGILTVYNGGSIHDVSINSSGSVCISSGGLLSGATVNSSGHLSVISGGTASQVVISSGGYLTTLRNSICHNTSASAALIGGVRTDGVLVNVSGLKAQTRNSVVIAGSAVDVTVWAHDAINRASMTYLENTRAANTVLYYADLTVSSGALISDTEVLHGKVYLQSGAVAEGMILSGGSVSSKGGVVYISSGAILQEAVLSSGGSVCISSGGFLSGATVNSSGHLSVISGGTASQVVISSGGYLTTLRNSICHNTSASAALIGGVRADGALINVSGLTAQVRNSVVIAGSAVDVTVWAHDAINRASMTYLENTRAANTVLYYADLTVSSGALISDTEVLHGKVYLQSGAVAEGMTLSGGSGSSDYGAVYVSSGAVLQDAVLYYGGRVYVSSGGTASDLTIHSSSHIYGNGFQITHNGSSAAEVSITADGTFSYVSGTVIANWYDSSFICITGSAYNNIFGARTKISVSGNAFVSGMILNSSAAVTASGGTLVGVTFNNKGSADIFSGALISSSTVNSGGLLRVQNGGSAKDITLHSSGVVHVSGGGFLSGATVNSSGHLSVISGGTASQVVISSGGYLTTLRNSICHNTSASAALIGGVRADGALINVSGLTAQVRNSVVIANSAVDVTVWAYDAINRASMTYLENTHAANTVLYCADLTVSSGSLISDTEVLHGKVYLQSGAVAEGMTLSGGSGASNYGAVYVSSGASLQEAVLHLGGSAFVTEGGVMAETSLCGGTLVISSGGIHRGSLEIVSKGKVSVSEGGRIDFTLDGRSAETDHLINDLSRISGSVSYTVTVSAGQTTGKYKLAAGAGAFTGTVSVVCEEVGYGTLSVNGETLTVRDKNYTLLLEEGSLLLDITAGPELTGDRNGIVFENISETTKKIEISRDGFETALQLQSTGEAVDIYGLPEGNYDWRVQQRETWLNGPVISVPENELPSPQYCISDNDGDTDLFFAAANGIWKKGYAAQHLGSDTWEGTGEQLLLAGKNKLADIFEGSADANILVLTDDANGDALFVDDIYTALGGQARISQIDEIRAGAGDDIVDMTSERYAYTGAEITIYGGSGNDTIWGGAESNILFGDAGSDRLVGGSGDDVIAGGSGNDSMHGGGGDDIFTFGGNWGNDTVEQLEGGSVTLWFETGSENNWNNETLTYSDGVNDVTVMGCANVTLRFGADASLPAGAFLDSASEKVFEDKNKGFIA